MRFAARGLDDPVPDAKTIWLYREQLTRAGASERLLVRFDAALKDKDLLAPWPALAGLPCGADSSALRSTGGRILDATAVQARPARLTAWEKAVVRGGETPSGWSPARRAQIDLDARWTLQRGRKRPPPEDGTNKRQQVETAVPIFGYESHVGIERRHGLIRSWTVTHAAAHDGGRLPALLDGGNTASGVWADTAERSAANQAALAKRGLTARLQRSGPRRQADAAVVSHVMV